MWWYQKFYADPDQSPWSSAKSAYSAYSEAQNISFLQIIYEIVLDFVLFLTITGQKVSARSSRKKWLKIKWCKTFKFTKFTDLNSKCSVAKYESGSRLLDHLLPILQHFLFMATNMSDPDASDPDASITIINYMTPRIRNSGMIQGSGSERNTDSQPWF